MDLDKGTATVHRITVDEKLAEDLIRLEICKLKKLEDGGEFKDEPGFWEDIAEEGEEIFARAPDPDNKSQEDLYTEIMSIPAALSSQFPWKDLTEGQVFLSGSFSVRESQNEDKKIKKYFYRPKENSFEQIDDEVKDDTKILYYEVLAQGEKNG